MGIAKRKYNSLIIELRKTLKRKFQGILKILPKEFTDMQFVELFKEIYADDWKKLQEYYEYYKLKDEELIISLKKKQIPNPQPRYKFPIPHKFVLQTNYHSLINTRNKHSKNEILSEEERDQIKKELLEESLRKHNKKIRLQEQKTITIQEVEPAYLDDLEQKLFSTDSLIERLHIVKEISKYKTERTIQMLYAVLAKEKDYFIRQMAFRNLQRFGQVVFLSRKGVGKKTKVNRLELELGDFKEDLGKTPIDIIRELNEDTIQNFKYYDIFLSHSSKDLSSIVNLVKEFNKHDLVVYVDWISDREELKRSNLSHSTSEVIKHRMNSSSIMVCAFSNNSIKSEWVYWEIGYFDALSKGICVFELDGNDFQNLPVFLESYPRLKYNESTFVVDDKKNEIPLLEWLQIKN